MHSHSHQLPTTSQSLMVILFSFSQRCINGFRIYDKEENFLNSNEKKTLSDKSLKHEEAVFWTKGEVLGRGAYGTVSSPRSSMLELSTRPHPSVPTLCT